VDDALRGASPILSTTHMPVILQHLGHSRTIVGYEMTKKGNVNLLTFDPSMVASPGLRRLALAGSNAAPTLSPSKKVQSSSSQGLRDFFHTLNQAKKRKAAGLSLREKENNAKRPRSNVDDEDEIIVVGESRKTDDAHQKGKDKVEDFNFNDVLKPFRLELQKLKRKDQYQILYFPLDEPLSEKQRLSRKEVISAKVS